MDGLLDQAVRLLDQQGFVPGDEEVFDLLTTANALRQREGDRALLRPAFLHRMLTDLPSAFSLFDRDGTKVASLAGSSAGPLGDALLATAPAGGELPNPAWAEITTASLATVGFDLLGSPPALTGIPRPLADLLTVCIAAARSGRPQLVRIGHPESLDGIRTFLSALRGSPREAEMRPIVILEAHSDEMLHWPPLACRILIDGARQGIPTAPVGPSATEPVGAVATLLAGILIHQLARREAPVMWGIPLELTGGCRLCHLAGRQLGLPQLATRTRTSPAHASPLEALQALISGAALIAWSGALMASSGQLLRDAAHAPEILKTARLLAPAEQWADPRVSSARDIETRLVRQAPRPADSALREALGALLQREAERTETIEVMTIWEELA